jgi:hypothetical protein
MKSKQQTAQKINIDYCEKGVTSNSFKNNKQTKGMMFISDHGMMFISDHLKILEIKLLEQKELQKEDTENWLRFQREQHEAKLKEIRRIIENRIGRDNIDPNLISAKVLLKDITKLVGK